MEKSGKNVFDEEDRDAEDCDDNNDICVVGISDDDHDDGEVNKTRRATLSAPA